MFFLIGARKFEVIIVNNLVRGGEVRDSWYDPERHQILINSIVPPERRRSKLFHELSHAWSSAHGLAGDTESQAQRDESFQDWMTEQYEAQGGTVALQAMISPPASTQAMAAMGGFALDQRPCGACGSPVMCGSFVNAEPVFKERFGSFVIERLMECEGCGSWTSWCETCSDSGEPLGRLVPYPQPKVLNGSEAARWMQEHQAAERVAG